MSEFGDHDDRSPCARCYGSEDILHSVVDSIFDLHAELSRLRPASRAYPYETREVRADKFSQKRVYLLRTILAEGDYRRD